jgi:uncharacterized protein YndB with AHSA1/START domain
VNDDIDREIDAVTRRVHERTLAEGEARCVTIARSYRTTLADLWDACTDPERIPRWFLPVSGELRLGGHYQLEGNASGTIERCEPPRSFAATWEYGGNISWIEVGLTAEADGWTRFELEHTALLEDIAHWTEFGPGAVGIGWDLGLRGLGRHLASGAAVAQDDGAAWMASEGGKAFVSLSSARWLDAAIAAGADPVEARAAAERTTAAYTGN